MKDCLLCLHLLATLKHFIFKLEFFTSLCTEPALRASISQVGMLQHPGCRRPLKVIPTEQSHNQLSCPLILWPESCWVPSRDLICEFVCRTLVCNQHDVARQHAPGQTPRRVNAVLSQRSQQVCRFQLAERASAESVVDDGFSALIYLEHLRGSEQQLQKHHLPAHSHIRLHAGPLLRGSRCRTEVASMSLPPRCRAGRSVQTQSREARN